MEPTITEKGQIILVGFSFFGDPFQISGDWTEENEIRRLWNRFAMYLTQHGGRIKHLKNPEVGYEVHIEHEKTLVKGNFEIFAGMEVERLEDLPVEILVKILPPTTYAVFTLKGQQITADWGRMIFHDWMASSGYQKANNYGFNLYDQRFKGLEKINESVIEVYIPVRKS